MQIPFAHSQRSSVGIEWELALVDADSGDLRQVAATVLDALRPAGVPEGPTHAARLAALQEGTLREGVPVGEGSDDEGSDDQVVAAGSTSGAGVAR